MGSPNLNDNAFLMNNMHESPSEQNTSMPWTMPHEENQSVDQQDTGQQTNPTSMMISEGAQTMIAMPMIQEESTPSAENFETDQKFRIGTFQSLGSVQIVLGTFMCSLSLVNAIVDGINLKKSAEPFTVEELVVYDIINLLIPGWFIFTGLVPVCMSKHQPKSWLQLKMVFMVCSIIGALGFVPTAFSLSLSRYFAVISRDEKITAILSMLSILLATAEFVIAVIAASFCYCFSRWSTSSAQ